MLNRYTVLYATIFIEGFVVLAGELLAIRQMIPYVGSGTDTVAIVISAVLLPLAFGYRAGGGYRHSAEHHRRSIRDKLLANLLRAGIILCIGLSFAPLELFFGALTHFGLTQRVVQTFLYSALFLVYPNYLLGQTIPLVSNYFPRTHLSRLTGRMLFASTIGSFLGSVFTTLVLMSKLGVNYTLILVIALIAVLSCLLSKRTFTFEHLALWLVVAMAYTLNGPGAMKKMEIVNSNVYSTVAIEKVPEAGNERVLVINNSGSAMVADDPKRRFEYRAYLEDTILAQAPKDATVLVIGAGGFTLGLHDNDRAYTYIDIDVDLKRVAEQEFLKQPLGPNKTFVPVPAESYIRTEKGTFDVIVVDAFTSIYNIPPYLVTEDFLRLLPRHLKKGGVIVWNVILSPDFADAFSVKMDNTIRAVFPNVTRQVVQPFNPWNTKADDHPYKNVLYMYYDRQHTGLRRTYTHNRNDYFLDR